MSFNIRSLDQAIRHLFGLLGRLAPTNKLRLTQIFGILEFLEGEQSNTESRKQALRKQFERTFMYGVPEGLGPQRYVITYLKTKLAVMESTALLWFIGQCSLGLPQISQNVLLS